MLNHPLVHALDQAFKMWAARKYDLCGVDDEGLGIYNVHPSDWQEGDLEMLEAWDHWLSYGNQRTNDQLEEWCLIADARGVQITHAGRFSPKEQKQRKQMLYVAGAGALAMAWWLFRPRDYLGVKAAGQVKDEEVRRALAPIIGKTHQSAYPEITVPDDIEVVSAT